MFDYDFLKETIQFLIQIGTLLTFISPFIWRMWGKLSRFFRDHSQIMNDFQSVSSDITEAKGDIKEMKDEFHNLNKAFRDYSAATDKRLLYLEGQRKVNDGI